MASRTIVIGTRGSQLALWQSNHIKSKLSTLYPNLDIRLQTIKTLGDKILDSPLSRIGDKGIFTKEIERALIDEKIDLAVHSFKDIPTQLPAGLAIGAVLEREDVRDVFIAHPKKEYKRLSNLPARAKIATGSLRRKCQLLQSHKEFEIIDIRGNLNTRLTKLEESEWDGMILAKAGVTRLGWEGNITEILSFDVMLPAAGQGALAVEVREGDQEMVDLIRPLHHTASAIAINAERALLRHLEGGCQIPVGSYGRVEQGVFRLDALIGSLDGRKVVRGRISGTPSDAEKLGVELATQLLKGGGKQILEEIRTISTHVPYPDA